MNNKEKMEALQWQKKQLILADMPEDEKKEEMERIDSEIEEL